MSPLGEEYLAPLRPVVAITQARIGSTRLPAKVLLPVAGRPILAWHLDRLRRARLVDRIVVATTDEPGSERIAEIAAGFGIDCFRGSVEDVLARFAGAAAFADAQTVLRVTSDCPLIDPGLVDALVRFYAARAGTLDYAALDVTKFPRGLDCEIMSRRALDEAAREATAAAEREHVTPFIRDTGRFGAGFLGTEPPVTGQRWCVDTPEDRAFVDSVLTAAGSDGATIGWRAIADLVASRPDWIELNRAVVQKAV